MRGLPTMLAAFLLILSCATIGRGVVTVAQAQKKEKPIPGTLPAPIRQLEPDSTTKRPPPPIALPVSAIKPASIVDGLIAGGQLTVLPGATTVTLTKMNPYHKPTNSRLDCRRCNFSGAQDSVHLYSASDWVMAVFQNLQPGRTYVVEFDLYPSTPGTITGLGSQGGPGKTAFDQGGPVPIAFVPTGSTADFTLRVDERPAAYVGFKSVKLVPLGK